MSMTPNSRYEQYLNAIASGDKSNLPKPITREEVYLYTIAMNGTGGGGGDVSGVKGAKESTYRRGNVNLTLPNITDVGNGLDYDAVSKVLRGIQYTSLPIASASLLDRILQYVGTSTGNLQSGHFYKCILKDAAYVWEDVLGDGAEPLTEEQINALLALLN